MTAPREWTIEVCAEYSSYDEAHPPQLPSAGDANETVEVIEKHAVAAAIAAERERCAVISESSMEGYPGCDCPDQIAKAIRAGEVLDPR